MNFSSIKARSILLILMSVYMLHFSFAQQTVVEKSQAKNAKPIEKDMIYQHMTISSMAFNANEMIPSQYTCDGININPPLEIKDIPKNTKSLALIMDDPDARANTWVHWVVWNVPVSNTIKENTIPGTEGMSDFQKQHYGGPCPPSGTHHYFFKLYALDVLLKLPETTEKLQMEKAMEGHILGYGELIGLYRRKIKK